MARDRSAAVAAVTAAVLLPMALIAVPSPAAAVPDHTTPRLQVVPTETGVPATVVATGSCPATDQNGSEFEITYIYPQEAQLAFPAAGVDSIDVTLDSGGEFLEEQHFSLPETLAPGTYTTTLTCPHGPYSTTDTAVAAVTVPPPIDPTLALNPSSTRVGQDVTATGTCPTSSEEVTLLLEGAVVGRVRVRPDGQFGPAGFSVPDLSPGPHRVSTSCGGGQDLTVVAVVPPSPSTSSRNPTGSPAPPSPTSSPSPAPSSSSAPPVAQVAVPDLSGLTEAQARDRLRDAGLVLADREGSGRVSRQSPPAGTLTTPSSPVRIVLAAESRPTTSRSPLLIAAVGLLVVAAAVSAFLWRARRWRRERRWLDHVSARLVEPRPAREFSGTPIGDAPGVSLRLHVRSASGAQQLQEVHRARNGAHDPGYDEIPDLAGGGAHR
jgi:hypothetical protein